MKSIVLLCLIFLVLTSHANDSPKKSVQQHTVVATSGNQSFLSSFIKGGQLYLDIPDHLLDKSILFTCYGRMRRSYMQVAWSKHYGKIVLKRQAISSTSGIILPPSNGLVQMDNILAIFPIETADDTPGHHRVNITDFILRQDIEWPQKMGVSLQNTVPKLSLLLGAKDMDNEVLIKTQRGMIKNKSKVSVPIFFGFGALGPPMESRSFDFRMGFYADEKMEVRFGLKNGAANIARWRLEKKYPDQEISVPIKPITFLISPEVPKKWRPYLKAGIEEWLPAFESAGFKDALVVKEVDSLDQWQAHSIHSNVVYWNQRKYFRGSEYEDYGGTLGHIIDLRTGEILRGDIFMGASERTVCEKYFVRAAPLDKRAQRFPFPDALTGRLFQVIAAHEAGHVFGIMDANFGEYHYPWNKMNDSLWLRIMGHTPSIMNYTRTNNIPQPEDSVPPTLLLQKVGPTDRYNIQWAYTEFPADMSAEDKRDALERMVRWQDSVPWYRFNINQMEVVGPNASDEVVETNDPVKSTKLALKNVKRVIGLIPEVSSGQNEDGRMERLYDKSIQLWNNHMLHVLTLVGGYDIHYKALGQPGDQFIPIPWEDQMEALDFLLENALEAPEWLTEPPFLERTGYSTFPDHVMHYQQKLVLDMLTARRIKRMENLEKIPDQEGLVNAYIERLQDGLFKELKEDFGHVDRRRQEVQMTYIDYLGMVFKQKETVMDIQSRFFVHSDYSKGIMMQHLLDLKKEIENRLKRNKESATSAYWQLCLKKVNSVL
ncbi:hypothetical protein Murru_2580 [Allomuricauda ruestringensis DSM 13258]|uniref:EcxA zinc-binding domain-containing protein n=1 Tax=Allomuricauda ruestringensis (strain DSM 13258 / CIP 107369 / LMG 19739 / B1) TaxID=886377 RepID=G2PQB0_ALLRU|nr:zinc-dependent metalloprotease [Allomuricauda ruestringensis]AEM71616.1 hypothetical protein Murru_2580 [Allomuricauda ruestringensis DSM 13258]